MQPASRWVKLGIDTPSYEDQHGCHVREGLLTCRFHPLPPGGSAIFAFADACFSIGSLVHPLPIRPFSRAPYVIEARILARWWDESPCFASFREPYDVYLWLKAWNDKRVDEWTPRAKMQQRWQWFWFLHFHRFSKMSKNFENQ